jgi:hypothetical protein
MYLREAYSTVNITSVVRANSVRKDVFVIKISGY